MTSQGIYTLANDVVYDQLIALLNSIEANVSAELPICIIPYDDRLEKVRSEIKNRSNVTLFDNQESIQRWEEFADKVWSAHPRDKESKVSRPKWYKGHLQRKFVAFDGEFDHFVFYEADNLAMKPVEDVFEKLKDYDFIFNDWEHRKPTPATALHIPLIEESGIYTEAEVRPKIHDASFFGGKKGLFPPSELVNFQDKLINQREVEWINGIGWWDDVFLFNYLTLRCDRPIYNFTQSPNGQDRTGNCADADPFICIDNVLYNEQGRKPIHRIHYMNYSSRDFARLCQGEDVNILYQDVFLHYRFLKNPDQKPSQLTPANPVTKASRKFQGLVSKIKRTIS